MDRESSVYEKRAVYQLPGMENAQVYHDLVYKSVVGTGLKLDVYMPPDLPDDTRLPGVLFIHGGPLPADTHPQPKDWGIFVSYGELMAASGLVGVTFNHRYHALTDLEQANQDILAAMQYVRERSASFRLDPDRLCLWAFSGGGPFLNIALRDKPDFVRCAVAYYAALDLSLDKDKKALGNEAFNKFALASCLAPDDYTRAPLLIARAGSDHPALNERIERFVHKAIAANATLDFVNHPQGQHGFDLLDDARSRHVIASTIAFIQANVRVCSPEAR